MRSHTELAPTRRSAFVAGMAPVIVPSAADAAGFRKISADGKVVLVAPVYQGINPEPPLSITALNVFAMEGDTVAMPEFHARPVFDAVSRDTPGNFQTLPGHHHAFIAPFAKWLAEMEDIPVAKDPEWFDRSAFPEELNARIAATFVDMSSAAGSGQRVLHALTSLMSGRPL